MRVIQTVNDTIRLLFNPKTEIFCLSDFLLVRDSDENFLGQVVEIFDDKFDQETNVAKIRLVYRIVNGGEVVPYDNYTPSRECEVAKIKQSEIEKCINLNKKIIELGINPKTREKTQINSVFFENKCVVFADKFEQTNRLFEILAPKFALEKPVLILDFSGTCLPTGAVSFIAGENFKMPLSVDTIDYIQQKTLLRAKLETQVVLDDVFEEIKKFLSDPQNGYISLPQLIKVIQKQCKMTPSVELLVLISWLKKYLRAGIFAKNKKEFEPVLKSAKKNDITTIDLSNIKSEWQKEFLDYLTGQINNEIYLLVRLNDNNINNDIINFIYLKKKNICFIPSFAYGYKKASYIMDFAQNYVLMPTLNPKRDFTHANFQIQSLNRDSFMIFGRDTKDFIFILENPAAEKKQEEFKEREKGFISLNLQLEDMTPFELKPDNFTVKSITPSSKRVHEEIRLADVLGSEITMPAQKALQETVPKEEIVTIEESAGKKAVKNEAVPDVSKQAPPDKAENLPAAGSEDTPSEPAALSELIEEDELDYFDAPEEDVPAGEEIRKQLAVIGDKNVSGIPNVSENDKGMPEISEPTDATIKGLVSYEEPSKNLDESTENSAAEAEFDQNAGKIASAKPIRIEKSMPKIKEKLAAARVNGGKLEEFAAAQKNSWGETAAGNIKEEVKNSEQNKANAGGLDNLLLLAQEVESVEIGQKIEETGGAVSAIVDEAVKENANVSDKVKTAQESIPEAEKSDIMVESAANRAKTKTEYIKEAAGADKAGEEIDRKFEEIMSAEKISVKSANSLQINEKVSIDLDKIKKEIKNPQHKLPIFNEDDEPGQSSSIGSFKEGDRVFHEKYGAGDVLKVISYGAKCLLQIDFPEVGRRLLDPKIARLKQTQEL